MTCHAEKAETETLEQRLRDAAQALRGKPEPPQYKPNVLGLVVDKCISDCFEPRREVVELEQAELFAGRESGRQG